MIMKTRLKLQFKLIKQSILTKKFKKIKDLCHLNFILASHIDIPIYGKNSQAKT